MLRGGGLDSKMEENRLGKVAKEAFSSGVETTFPSEQITIGVTSFGELLYQRRSQRRPKQKRDLYSTECILESQKTNRPRREAPRRNVMESKHTEAAPGRRAEGGNFGKKASRTRHGGGYFQILPSRDLWMIPKDAKPHPDFIMARAIRRLKV